MKGNKYIVGDYPTSNGVFEALRLETVHHIQNRYNVKKLGSQPRKLWMGVGGPVSFSVADPRQIKLVATRRPARHTGKGGSS